MDGVNIFRSDARDVRAVDSSRIGIRGRFRAFGYN